MPEPAFDTLETARRLKSAGIDSEHAEAIVEVMGQSVNQLVTREHFDLAVEHFDLAVEHFDLAVGRFDATIASLRTELCARIDTVQAELHTRIGGVESNVQSLESKVQSLEATLRTELMRGILIAVGVLIPAIGLMMAIAEFYSARGGGA